MDTAPAVAHKLPDHVAIARMPCAAVRPELHALVIGDCAVGITAITTNVEDGCSTTTITTEDGGTWPRPSGLGAAVAPRADLRAPGIRPFERAEVTADDWQAETDRLAALPTRTREEQQRMHGARARAAYARCGWPWPTR
jgi:hypothetical protein